MASPIWRPTHEDRAPLWLLVLLPALIALPQLIGLIHADPALIVGNMSRGDAAGWLAGSPFADPNAGFTAQPLGRLGAWLWLHFQVPWWNSYSGVGLPLAAEYQSNVFTPLVLLLLLPHGLVWQHLALQIIAGFGCYALARQLGLGRLAALLGGLLFAFNGTFAWFADAPPGPGAYLPWVLLGIEHAAIAARTQTRGGWRLLGIAMALMLLAGFPETAFINGLLALCWSALRFAQSARRVALAWRVALGGTIGVLIASPQILAFLEILPLSLLGPHTGPFLHYAVPPEGLVTSLLAPYAWGPINGIGLPTLWARMGGYVDLPLLMVAGLGWWARRDALAWLLAGWLVAALTKVFGLEPFTALWNLVPGVGATGFFRYAAPSWELAAILLAACGVEAIAAARTKIRVAALMAGLGLAVGVAAAIVLWPQLGVWRIWTIISGVWALLCAGLILARPQARFVAALLVLDGVVMFTIPVLANHRAGKIDRAAISFLQQHLGLQRFYTLAPIAPNEGAYFQIASINHNYIPLPTIWGNYLADHVDPGTNRIIFTGINPRPPGPSAEHALQTNLAGFEQLGVKYVVAPPDENPFGGDVTADVAAIADRAMVLNAGQSAHGIMAAAPARVAQFGISAGYYNNRADGTLSVTLCAAGQCQSGSDDLTRGRDGRMFWITLAQPLAVPAGTPVDFTLLHQGGSHPVALYLYRSNPDQSLPGEPGMGLKLTLRPASASRAVFADDVMAIYQTPAPQPYFEAPCRLAVASHTALAADCDRPARLLRRELFFPGWAATIEGKSAPITMVGGLFQAVDLPAGHSEIAFAYAPPHIIWAWLAAGFGLLVLAASGCNWRRHKIHFT